MIYSNISFTTSPANGGSSRSKLTDTQFRTLALSEYARLAKTGVIPHE
jgi:hypothetical protein